jgi:metal-sulfur cluster biosynthetic enzyme
MPTKDQIMERLRTVVDPEIGINIVDLGLVYGVEIDNGRVHVKMTMTTVGCPLHEVLLNWAERALADLPDVESVKIELVWDPPWNPEMMTENARKQLGFA